MPLNTPLTRPLTQPLTRALSAAGVGGFTPLLLPNLQAWYDPSDLSTMFQDTAGTVPVTAAGQPVARINDKSGNGRHLLQATGANQPTLEVDVNGKRYLDFNGTSDFLSVAFSPAAYPYTLAVAAQSNTTQEGGILSLSQSDSSYKVVGSSTTAGTYFVGDRNATNLTRSSSVLSLSGQSVIATVTAALLKIYANSTEDTRANTNVFGAPTAIFMGKSRPAGLFYTGRLYQGVIVSSELTTDDRGRLRDFLLGKL